MNDSHLKVKLYGESFRIHQLGFTLEQLLRYNEIAFQLNQPLHIALLNFDFYLLLKDRNINSIQDFKKGSIGGLINNHQSQIEIWFDRKKVSKFNLRSITNSNTLFPLFNTNISKFLPLHLKAGFYVEEREIGLINTYELRLQNFKIDNLEFHITELVQEHTNYKLLSNLHYNESKMTQTKSDTLLRHQYCNSIK